jgi:hypothetical protein
LGIVLNDQAPLVLRRRWRTLSQFTSCLNRPKLASRHPHGAR